MVTIGEIFSRLSYSQTLFLTVASVIALWLLSGPMRNWLKQEWKFLKYAAAMDGPQALPLIGNALYFACSYNEILPRVIKMAENYNYPFRFWLGPKLVIGVRNPRDIEVVMTSPVATDKPHEYRFVASYMGLGVATDSGVTHRASRKLFMPMVNGKALNTYFDAFDRQSRQCVKCLEKHVDAGEFDVMHYTDFCTLDVILETIMGTAGTAQLGGYNGLIGNSSKALMLVYERTIKAWLHQDWIYDHTKDGQEYARAIGAVRDFTDKLIINKQKDRDAGDGNFVSKDGVLPEAVLDRLITHNGKENYMDTLRIRNEITNIWMPAQDPTALTTAFLFIMLGMHPEIQDKVRAEVSEVIGDGDLTLEHLQKLKYLELVIKETIRMFPVGPILLRGLQDDLQFENCVAPKGATVALFLYAAHRDPNYWSNPNDFIPERFTPENSVGRHPFAYVPFSHGVRGCIGRNYAMMLMKTMVARVVQAYQISTPRTMETLRLKASISVRAIDEYSISITRVRPANRVEPCQRSESVQ